MSPVTTRRRPRFGDLLLLGGARYHLCATVMAPTRGYWVRPDGADDASRDRLLTLAEWHGLQFNAQAERWEAAL